MSRCEVLVDVILSKGLIDRFLAPFPGTAMSSKKNGDFPLPPPPPPDSKKPKLCLENA